MNTELDHLVVAARTLDEGAAWCEATLGVVPGPGGRHALMGTHNRLLALGGPRFSRAYLEIIAIDPEAPPPGRPRWFGLDTPALQAAIAEAPRLVHVVARSPNLDMHRWGLMACGFDPGTTRAAERETPAGPLRWRITIPDDGLPRCGGALPTLIEWGAVHPVDTMAPPVLALERLLLRGLPAQPAQVLRLRGVERDDTPGPAIEAVLDTPRGRVTLAAPELPRG